MTPPKDPADARLALLLGDLSEALDQTLEANLAPPDGPPLRRLAARRRALERYRRDLAGQLERIGHAAVVTLVGATGAGKSSLLNALVGADVATPGTTRPTTSRPVIHRPADADVTALLAGLPGETPEVIDHASGSARGPWTQHVLVDAPDVNSVAAEHRAVVEALAERSDVLVVVTHRQSVAELASVSFVDAFAGRRALLVVLNRADELEPAAREELVAELERLARERWGAGDGPAAGRGDAPPVRVVATSALEARTRPDTPGWDELCATLAELVRAGSLGRVRRANALGSVARLAEVARAVREDADDDLAALAEAVRAALEAFGARLATELDERLELRRRDVAELLWNETARRWDGPGGLALRAGGLAGLGLGAGAMLARRNPLVAAGTAAGAAVLDRARGALRERRIERGSGLVPTEVELAGWYREEFGRPRLLAQDLTGDPGTPGVPGGDALAAAGAEAIEGAWTRLLERDLVEAARRGAPFAVKLVVDLPVYALCGWVVWRAGLGLWGAEPVGGALLIDAGIVALAWLWGLRLLLRAWLGWRARALVAGVGAAARAGLDDALDLAGERAHAVVEARRAALGDLATADARWREAIDRTP